MNPRSADDALRITQAASALYNYIHNYYEPNSIFALLQPRHPQKPPVCIKTKNSPHPPYAKTPPINYTPPNCDASVDASEPRETKFLFGGGGVSEFRNLSIHPTFEEVGVEELQGNSEIELIQAKRGLVRVPAKFVKTPVPSGPLFFAKSRFSIKS